MNKISAIILLLFFCFKGNCQTVTITDIMDHMSCKDFSCINDFITAKGFSYTKSADKDTHITYIYSSDDAVQATSSKELLFKNEFHYTVGNDGKILLKFVTVSKPQYQELMKEVTALKFTVVTSSDLPGGMRVMIYGSPAYKNMSLYIILFSKKTEYGGSASGYGFQLQEKGNAD